MKAFMGMVEQLLRDAEDHEAELRAAFRCIDTDNSGTITSKELRHYMTRVGEKLSEKEVCLDLLTFLLFFGSNMRLIRLLSPYQGS